MAPETDSFDWVTARHRCSLAMVFQILAEIVDTNVKTANRLRNPDVTFERKVLDGKFMVVRVRDLGRLKEASSVVFELAANSIGVKGVAHNGAETPLFSARPSLTEEGRCVLEIDGKAFSLWQVSRNALEDLFFGV